MSQLKSLYSCSSKEREALLTVSIDAEGWRELEGMVCVDCLHSAFVHPETNDIWGCKQCKKIVSTEPQRSLAFAPRQDLRSLLRRGRDMEVAGEI